VAKVLIIDDEKLIRESLKEFLEMTTEKEVIEAANGMQGVSLAVKEKPEVIFCDIGLPDISGTEVIRQLRNNQSFKGTLIIVMSAEYDNEKKALESGANAFLRKPYSISDVETAMGGF
jgi:YesN/AraC family two-component response regulator